MESHVRNKSIEHLRNVGNTVKQICPSIWKYYMLLLHQSPQENTENASGHKIGVTCKHCGSAFLPGSCRVRLHARPVLTKKMKKLMSKQQKLPWLLRRAEREKVSVFKSSHNRIVYQCFRCSSYTEYNGSRYPHVPTTPNIVLHCQKTKRKRKKEINAGLLPCLNESQASSYLGRSSDLSFPTFAETPIGNKSLLESILSESTGTPSFSVTESLFKRLSLERTLTHSGNRKCSPPAMSKGGNKAMSTPIASKKHKKSSLLQMLKEDEERNKLSSSSLSSFLSSL